MLKKNQKLTLTCRALGAELEGVCDYEGQTVFVPGALPGERFEALIVQARSRYAFGKLLKLSILSPDRVEPPCPAYKLCGGCSGQHMRYEATLAAKRRQALDCLTRIGGLPLTEDDVPPVLGAAEPFHGRNKTSLPVGGTLKEPMIGFYQRRSHHIVPIEDCRVAMPGLREAVAAVRAWMTEAHVVPYDEETGDGLLRHVIVRQNRAGEALVLLVATSEALPDVPLLTEKLRSALSGFRGLHVSENRVKGNVILGRTSLRLWGEEAITETLLGLTFEISPLSFFQVNPAQTERLYQCALDYAQLSPRDVAVDAYAGAGTIALLMAQRASRVIGLEIVPQAVESARRNAERNGIANVEFHAAAVEDRLPKLVAEGLRPDVIVLDPPRKGVEPAVIEAVLAAAPRRVVYVSCHVPTQARDAALLAQGGYRFVGCQPVDLFCWAGGVENVLCMEKS